MASLSLEIVFTSSTRDAICSVCSTGFDLTFPAAILYFGDRPLGYLCERCLMLGPTAAAPEVRARASGLRGSIPALRGAVWTGMRQAILERAEFWESLADELDKVGRWMLRPLEGVTATRPTSNDESSKGRA